MNKSHRPLGTAYLASCNHIRDTGTALYIQCVGHWRKEKWLTTKKRNTAVIKVRYSFNLLPAFCHAFVGVRFPVFTTYRLLFLSCTSVTTILFLARTFVGAFDFLPPVQKRFIFKISCVFLNTWMYPDDVCNLTHILLMIVCILMHILLADNFVYTNTHLASW